MQCHPHDPLTSFLILFPITSSRHCLGTLEQKLNVVLGNNIVWNFDCQHFQDHFSNFELVFLNFLKAQAFEARYFDNIFFLRFWGFFATFSYKNFSYKKGVFISVAVRGISKILQKSGFEVWVANAIDKTKYCVFTRHKVIVKINLYEFIFSPISIF